MNEKKIIYEISQLMLDKKALDIQIINVKGLTSITDYFINCSSQSDPQTRAIKNHIQDSLFEKYQIKPLHIEDKKESIPSFISTDFSERLV